MHDHDAYARSIVMCWPNEAVPAMEWANFIRTNNNASSFAALVDSLYGRWMRLSDKFANSWMESTINPFDTFSSVTMIRFFTEFKDYDAWKYTSYLTSDSVIAVDITKNKIVDEIGDISGYEKKCDQSLKIKYIDGGERIAMIDEFPSQVALTMTWAILTNRWSNVDSREKFRNRYMKSNK